jgi:hypothetical protein
VIDLIYLAHNRLEFTKATIAALAANTNWDLVDQFILYDDNSTDGTREYLKEWLLGPRVPARVVPRFEVFGHPVNVMRDYLQNHRRHSIFGKIDSDTMVPPGWLDESFGVMDRHPELDLLGIEVMNPVEDVTSDRGYTASRFIGGIGLMRASAFITRPEPNGKYFGFTEWQERNPQVSKGWINPAIPVFLLDRLPMEPWQSLSAGYVERIGQRDWPKYSPKSTDLWSWWITP